MKLYELNRGDHFRIEGIDREYKLHNIDGMYSYCTDEKTGEVVHYAAFADVVKVDAETGLA